MIANDDPAELLREHGWRQEVHGSWKLARADGVLGLCDRSGDAPRSLYEPCLAGTLDEPMDPVQFPTVVGAVRWLERHTAGELRARAGGEVWPSETG